MREILRTNDPVVLTFVEALLRDAGLRAVVADAHMSSVEGSIGILPRRILVEAQEWARARRLLNEAGLGALVVGDDVA
jgi:hypothetical protein